MAEEMEKVNVPIKSDLGVKKPNPSTTEGANETNARAAQVEKDDSGDGIDYHTDEPSREMLDKSHANVRDAKQALASAKADLELAREQAAWDELPVKEKERQLKVKEEEKKQVELDRVTPENLEEKMAASHPATEARKAPRDPDAPFVQYDAEYNDEKDHRTRNVRVISREGPNQVKVKFENGFEKVVPENEVMEGGVPRGVGIGRQGPPGV